jgi:hypothetical protein
MSREIWPRTREFGWRFWRRRVLGPFAVVRAWFDAASKLVSGW